MDEGFVGIIDNEMFRTAGLWLSVAVFSAMGMALALCFRAVWQSRRMRASRMWKVILSVMAVISFSALTLGSVGLLGFSHDPSVSVPDGHSLKEAYAPQWQSTYRMLLAGSISAALIGFCACRWSGATRIQALGHNAPFLALVPLVIGVLLISSETAYQASAIMVIGVAVVATAAVLASLISTTVYRRRMNQHAAALEEVPDTR